MDAATKTAHKAHTRARLQALSQLAERSTGPIGSSVSHRSWCPHVSSSPPIACRPMRCRPRSTSSSAPIAPRCRTTGVTCWSPSRWSTLLAGRGRLRAARLHRSAAGPGPPGRPLVPAGEGGDGLGARGSPAEETLQAQPARRSRTAADAGRERYLSAGRRATRRIATSTATAPRYEGLGRRRVTRTDRDELPRPAVRMDAGPDSRPLGRLDRDLGRPSGRAEGFDRAITDLSERTSTVAVRAVHGPVRSPSPFSAGGMHSRARRRRRR